MHDHDDEMPDFAMLDLPTRPGPAKASAAPEQDPVEKRLARGREAAPFIAGAIGFDGDCGGSWRAGRCSYIDGGSVDGMTVAAIEVKHGSGKVKV